MSEKPDDRDVHALVTDLRELRDAPLRTRLFHGLAVPFRAAKFVLTTTRLWKFVLIPALINVALFAGALYLLFPRIDALIGWLQLETSLNFGWEWLRTALEWVLFVVLGILSIATAYVVVLLFGGVAAAPFNDLLSKRAERILLGIPKVPDREESILWGAIRAVAASLFMLVCYLFFMAWIILFNLIPVVGPPLASILGTVLSALFLAVEYCDPPIDRRGGGLRRKFEAVEAHRVLSIGFGLGATLLFWVPFLNFLTIPIAVVGGTALGVVLSEWEQDRDRARR